MTVVGSWVGIKLGVSAEGAGVGVAVAGVDSGVPWGVGVGVILAGDGAMELGSAIAETDVGVAAGVGGWPEQATRIIRTGRSAQS